MKRLPRRAVGPVLVLLAVGMQAAVAALSDPAVTASSTFTAAPDWTHPAAGSTVIAKATGYLAGSIRQNGSYRIYANVTDTGAPASGVATVRANVSSISGGQTAVALTAGAFSAEGVSYGYRSAALNAAASPNGTKTWSLTMTDGAGNTGTVAGAVVTLDNTPPTASDVQTANKAGGIAGRAEIGDTITFTFSEAIDPESVVSGWTGAATDVVVRLIDGGCLLNLLVTICNDDSFAIWNAANSAPLAFGTVDLNDNDYHALGLLGTAPVLTFGASGTPSTMVRSGETITITLGTGSASASTASGTTTTAWAPAAGPYDAAGNGLTTGGVSEGGAGDREF